MGPPRSIPVKYTSAGSLSAKVRNQRYFYSSVTLDDVAGGSRYANGIRHLLPVAVESTEEVVGELHPQADALCLLSRTVKRAWPETGMEGRRSSSTALLSYPIPAFWEELGARRRFGEYLLRIHSTNLFR